MSELPAGDDAMRRWLQREADVCGMSTDEVIVAALAEYRARRTPESRLRFRDGTPNYHHRNVEFIEDVH